MLHFVDNEPPVFGFCLRFRLFSHRSIQERKMKKVFAVLIASALFVGSAVAETPGATGATTAAAGGMTAGMIAATVAVVAVAIAASSNDNNGTPSTPSTTTTTK